MLEKSKDKEVYYGGSKDGEIGLALRMISDCFMIRSGRDKRNKMIRELWESGFEISSPDGNKKIGSKTLQQCLWRVLSKYQFLDFQLHSSSRDEDTERIATSGFSTIVKNGGLMRALADKGGAWFYQMLLGDGYIMMGEELDKEIGKASPINFRVVDSEDIYYELNSNGIRGTKPSNKLAVIFSYAKDEAYALYPELEEKGVFGRIPGSYEKLEDERENLAEMGGVVEVCYFYNLLTKTFTKFAGSECYELSQVKGKEYPFYKRGKAYIPVFQFICMPSYRGFTNYGLGDLFFDLAVISQRMLNLELSHAENMVYPLTVFNTPGGKADELIKKMAVAYKAREAGRSPFIAMDFGSNAGNNVQTQSLVSQNLLNEWQVVWDTLTREISRLGIYIDDVDRGSGYTATQVYAEEDASNAFTKQMGLYNTTETEELLESILEAIKAFVSKNNDTPINMTTRIHYKDGSEEKMNMAITLGLLKGELDKGNYFVVVNSKTGSVPSNAMRIAQLERQISMTAPGTPEMMMLYKQHAMLMGIDLGDAGAPQVQEQAPQAGAGSPQGALPGGTERAGLPTQGKVAQQMAKLKM